MFWDATDPIFKWRVWNVVKWFVGLVVLVFVLFLVYLEQTRREEIEKAYDFLRSLFFKKTLY